MDTIRPIPYHQLGLNICMKVGIKRYWTVLNDTILIDTKNKIEINLQSRTLKDTNGLKLPV